MSRPVALGKVRSPEDKDGDTTLGEALGELREQRSAYGGQLHAGDLTGGTARAATRMAEARSLYFNE